MAGSYARLEASFRLAVTQAFRGADAAFILTDFTTAKTAEKEFQQGKNAIHAAKEVRQHTFPIPSLCQTPSVLPQRWAKGATVGLMVPHDTLHTTTVVSLWVPSACIQDMP